MITLGTTRGHRNSSDWYPTLTRSESLARVKSTLSFILCVKGSRMSTHPEHQTQGETQPLSERSDVPTARGPQTARGGGAALVGSLRALPVLVLAALLTACGGQGGGTASTSPVDAENAAIEHALALSEDAPVEFIDNADTVCSVMRATGVTFDTYMTKDASHLDAYYWALLGVAERCPELMGDAS